MSTRDVPAQLGDLPPIGRPANSALLHAGITSLAELASLGRGNCLPCTALARRRYGFSKRLPRSAGSLSRRETGFLPRWLRSSLRYEAPSPARAPRPADPQTAPFHLGQRHFPDPSVPGLPTHHGLSHCPRRIPGLPVAAAILVVPSRVVHWGIGVRSVRSSRVVRWLPFRFPGCGVFESVVFLQGWPRLLMPVVPRGARRGGGRLRCPGTGCCSPGTGTSRRAGAAIGAWLWGSGSCPADLQRCPVAGVDQDPVEGLGASATSRRAMDGGIGP